MAGVTMVITTHMRGTLLRNSFERLAHLTQPAEIIVVDDGGNDETQDVCREYNERLRPEVRYVYNNNPGPSICSLARNVGVRLASHDWIVTSEPELLYLTDVLAQLCELQPDHPEQVISAGKVYFAPAGWTAPDASGPPTSEYGPPVGAQEAIGWVAPYTALWYRPWLEAVRGWDECFPGAWGWDDIDLLTRLRISGIGQHIALDIEGVHQYHGLGGDHNQQNENYWRQKSFQGDERDLTDVVANRDHEWGQVRA